MLQYIVKTSDTESILAQAREAIGAGVRWIELKIDDSVSDDSLEDIIKVLKQEAADAECALTVASRVELAKSTQIDGVQLYSGDESAAAARVTLDGGPIIGVSVSSQDEVERTMHLDVDYFRFEPVFGDNSDNLALTTSILKMLHDNSIYKPLAVAGGIKSVDNVSAALKAGAAGVAVDSSIASADKSIKDALKELLSYLEKP